MNSVESCPICFQSITSGDKVEILLKNIRCKTILGKYTWHPSPYCFACFQSGRKLLWRHFISLLLESDVVCAANMLASLKYYDIPLRLTDNMRINGAPIYALYYRKEMLSSKLEIGMSELGLEIFREKIKNAKTVMELEMAKGLEKTQVADTVLTNLLRDLKVC